MVVRMTHRVANDFNYTPFIAQVRLLFIHYTLFHKKVSDASSTRLSLKFQQILVLELS